MSTVLPTTLVGSYPQPDWLIDRAKLAGRFPPRVRAKSSGELRRSGWSRLRTMRQSSRSETKSARALTSLPMAKCAERATRTDLQPRWRVSISTTRARHLIEADTLILYRALSAKSEDAIPCRFATSTFLRANTDRMIKTTVPGAFTMAQQAQNDFYKDEVELAMDYAAAINEEIKDLFAAGADVVQIDEPYMQARPAKAKQYRHRGFEPLPSRHHRDDCGASMLRIRCDHSSKTVGLFVPTRTRGCRCATNFNRNRTIAPRLQRARGTSVKDHHSRRFRSLGYDCGNASDCCRPHSTRVAVCRCKQDHRSARLRPKIFAA